MSADKDAKKPTRKTRRSTKRASSKGSSSRNVTEGTSRNRKRTPSTSEDRSGRKKRRSPDSTEANQRPKSSTRRRTPPKTVKGAHAKASRSRFTPPTQPKEPLWQRIQEWFDVSNEPEIVDTNLRTDSAARVKFGGGMLALGLSILVMRAGYLMLWPNPMLEQVTKQQYENTETIRGRRGDIMDRDGRLIATTVTLHKVILSPIHIPVEHLDLVSEVIAKHLSLDASETKAKILAKRAKESQYLVMQRSTPRVIKTSCVN